MKVNQNENQALQKQQSQKGLVDWLKDQQKLLEVALPKNTIGIDRFMQSCLLEVMNPKQPLLRQCDPMSIFRSLKESASLGLEVGGVLGQAFLIPYNEKGVMTCHFQMGYKGLIALARRSNTIKTIACEIIHENDIVDVQLGCDRTLKHTFDFKKPRGAVVGYYCLIELTNGGIQFDIESVEEIKEHRAKFSKAYRPEDPNNIWNKNFDAMALKTCCIQALKLCPISIEALEAVRKEEIKDSKDESLSNYSDIEYVDFSVTDDIPVDVQIDRANEQQQKEETEGLNF